MRNFGGLPLVVMGFFLIVIGLWLLNLLVNKVWLVPVSSAQFSAFQRAAMSNTIDPSLLIEASDWGLIVLFLICIAMIGFGLALPIFYLINRRVVIMRHTPPATFAAIARRSLWFAIWLVFCFWLQMSRTLGLPVALLFAIVFILFEALIYIRRQSEITAAAAAE